MKYFSQLLATLASIGIVPIVKAEQAIVAEQIQCERAAEQSKQFDKPELEKNNQSVEIKNIKVTQECSDDELMKFLLESSNPSLDFGDERFATMLMNGGGL